MTHPHGYERTVVWRALNEQQRKELMDMGEAYKAFLDASKTERLCTQEILRQAQAAGYRDISTYEKLVSGDKVSFSNRDKAVLLCIIGEQPLTAGLRIVGSHVDAPRIDLKQVPLYEAEGLALLKTHYYGGLRNYQWVTRPLALIGTVIRRDGSAVNIEIGQDPQDPVLYITDILPHLGKDQDSKPLSEAISGEMLTPLVGSFPADGEEGSARDLVLDFLWEKYGMEEADFISAELELVPADRARDAGLDRSMVAAYGQDDRVCAFATLQALLPLERHSLAAVGLFVDKEEVGSMGNTGMHSAFFDDCVGQMLSLQDGSVDFLRLRQVMSNSTLLSADVTACYDPNFDSAFEKQNSAHLGRGVAMMKYTGKGGKSGSSDASAELVGRMRKLFLEREVIFQTAELGKVGHGGGGTIAYIMANRNMDCLDMGVPVLSMHSPCELVSKADVYMATRAYQAFFTE